MKKILMMIIAVAALSLAGKTQTKPVLTAVIKTPNALCQVCKERIEGQLKRYDGVAEATVNFKKRGDEGKIYHRPDQYRRDKSYHCQLWL